MVKIVLGECLRIHSRKYLDITDSEVEIKSHLDKVLRVHAPSHFLPFNSNSNGENPIVREEDIDERIDNIDRFTMVKSRIV